MPQSKRTKRLTVLNSLSQELLNELLLTPESRDYDRMRRLCNEINNLRLKMGWKPYSSITEFRESETAS